MVAFMAVYCSHEVSVKSRRGGLHPLELELQTAKNHLVGTGIELRSFVGAARALNHEVMSPVPNLLQEQNNNMKYLFLKFFF